jgi:hypothetical protein
MHVYNNVGRKLVLVLAFVVIGSSLAIARTGSEYKFKVHSNTDQAIKKILVSRDGKKYGYFDIGSGIAAGATVELVWNESTDTENCEQFFKAVFADGEESEPVEFDFCEKGLVLEFK